MRIALIAGALALVATFVPANAAPLGNIASSTAPSALSGSTVENVGWERRRHCRRGHCHWRRVWVPGVNIYIGKGHRHRHHRHHHRRHRH